MQNNNLVTEIFAGILAALLVIGGVLLLYFGKIPFDSTILFITFAAGLIGVPLALKAPSSAQMQQLNSQQEAMTQLALQMANTHAALLAQAHIHAEPVQAAVPIYQAVDNPPNTTYVPPQPQFITINRHFPGDSQVMPIVTPQQP